MIHSTPIRIRDRARRGHVVVTLLFPLLVFFALLALIWNVGETASRRVEIQTMADGAAHDAATILSRSTNTITHGNRLIVRSASVESLSLASPFTVVFIVRNWIEKLESTPPWAWISVAAQILFVEVPPVWDFLTDTVFDFGPGSFGKLVQLRLDQLLRLLDDPPAARERIEKIHEFQQDVFRDTPLVIDRQRRASARALGAELLLARPGGGALRPPVEPGDAASLRLPLLLQVLADRRGWERGLRNVRYGKGPQEWRTWTLLWMWLVAELEGKRHYQHVSHRRFGFGPVSAIVERAPTEEERERSMTVVASAARSGPSRRGILWPGVFRDGINPRHREVAVAQAETFQPLESASAWRIFPWRVWTRSGANWQTRITVGTAVDDADLHGMLEEGGLDGSSKRNSDGIMLH